MSLPHRNFATPHLFPPNLPCHHVNTRTPTGCVLADNAIATPLVSEADKPLETNLHHPSCPRLKIGGNNGTKSLRDCRPASW
jgi:hypothetical protein